MHIGASTRFASTLSGTLQLWQGDRGLAFEADIPVPGFAQWSLILGYPQEYPRRQAEFR